MPIPLLPLDDRTYDDLVKEMRALIPRYAPAWTDHLPSDPGIMLLELFSWLTEMLIYRENRITDASRKRFVELLGFGLRSAQAATVKLSISVAGLSRKLILPRNTPLNATRAGWDTPVPYETAEDVYLVPESAAFTVEARQSRFVIKERLGVGSGQPNQSYRLSHSYVYLGDAGAKQDLRTTVGEDIWTYSPTLWEAESTNKIFTVDILRNSICFGAGGQQVTIPLPANKPIASIGDVPPDGAPVVASYHYTLGKNGNLPKDVTYELEVNSPSLNSDIRSALDDGAVLTFAAMGEASGGMNPSSFDDLRSEIVHELDTPWRAVAKTDFERIVLEQQDVNIARVSCLAERDLDALAPEVRAPGHVSVIIVPGHPPERPGKPAAMLCPGEISTDQLQVSPDGKRMATLHGGTASFKMWVEENGAQLVDLPETSPITSIIFSPDGQSLAWASGDNIIRLWDVQKNQLIGMPLFAGAGVVTCLAFSPDGQTIAAGTRAAGKRKGAVMQWDVQTRRQLQPAIPVLVPPGQPVPTDPRLWVQPDSDCDVLSAVFSPDSRLIAFGTEDVKDPRNPSTCTSLILLWDCAYQRLWEPIFIDAKGVFGLAFSPDGARLAAACGDGVVRLWYVESLRPDDQPRSRQRAKPQKPIESSDRHTNGAIAVVFSRDGATLASAGKDGRVGLWPMPQSGHRKIEGKYIRFSSQIDPRVHVTSIDFDLDGTMLVAGGDNGVIKVCDVTSEKPEFRPISEKNGPTLSDQNSPSPSDQNGPPSAVTGVAFSPTDKMMLACGRKDGNWSLGTLGKAGQDTEYSWKPTGHQSHGGRALSAPTCSVFSSDGRWFAVVVDNQAVQVWSMDSLQQVTELWHGTNVRAVVFRPDSRWLVTCSGCTTCIWDVETWALFARFVHPAPVVEAVFSPNGWQLVTLGQDGSVELWSLDRRQRVDVWRHPPPASAVFSLPDGRMLATFGRDTALRVCDTETGMTWSPIADPEQDQPITRAAFRLGDRRVATYSEDGVFRQWSINGDQPDWKLEAKIASGLDTASVYPSPDLHCLVAVNQNENPELPQIWDLDSNKPIAGLYHDSEVQQIVFSEDGVLVATASEQTLQVDDEHSAELKALLDKACPNNTSDNNTSDNNTSDNKTSGSVSLEVVHKLQQTLLSYGIPLSSDLSVTADPFVCRQSQDRCCWQIKDQRQRYFVSMLPSPAGAKNPGGDGLKIWTTVVQVWDTRSGRQLAVLNCGFLETMQFTDDSKRLVTLGRCHAGAIIQVWQADHVQATYKRLDERRLITTRHHVVGATYQAVRVEAHVVCENRANPERLAIQIKKNLRRFFDPLKGGPDARGAGWPYGRDVYESEVYQVIENTAGVDHVESLTLWVLKPPSVSQDDKSKESPPIKDKLLVWDKATDHYVPVASNDLVRLTLKADDIRLRSVRSTR